MEGQIEASSESMVGRVIFHDCTGDKPQRTGRSINQRYVQHVSIHAIHACMTSQVPQGFGGISYNLTLAHRFQHQGEYCVAVSGLTTQPNCCNINLYRLLASKTAWCCDPLIP